MASELDMLHNVSYTPINAAPDQTMEQLLSA